MTVDGCTSTNDTVLVLASGRGADALARASLTAALGEVCTSLAEQMVDDAEGATKVSHVRVIGAEDDEPAHTGGPQGGRLHAGAVLPERRGSRTGAGW